MVKFSQISTPKGCFILAQGNALGKVIQKTNQALKGRLNAVRVSFQKILSRPFRACEFYYVPVPRALPWARISRPVGAGIVTNNPFGAGIGLNRLVGAEGGNHVIS